ncbi:hypothetical protein EMIT048CA2_80162 [Pseudomonas chlororaphis]
MRFSGQRRDGINPIESGGALLWEESERFEGRVFILAGWWSGDSGQPVNARAVGAAPAHLCCRTGFLLKCQRLSTQRA